MTTPTIHANVSSISVVTVGSIAANESFNPEPMSLVMGDGGFAMALNFSRSAPVRKSVKPILTLVKG